MADFGIAKTLDAAPADLTGSNQLLGTPAYLAPERLDGLPATSISDLYAFGVVLYEGLAGLRAFPGSTPLSVAYAIQHAEVAPLGQLRPDLPVDMVEVVERAMNRSPDRRFRTATEMAAALERAPEDGDHDSTTVMAAPTASSATVLMPVGAVSASGSSAGKRGRFEPPWARGLLAGGLVAGLSWRWMIVPAVVIGVQMLIAVAVRAVRATRRAPPEGKERPQQPSPGKRRRRCSSTCAPRRARLGDRLLLLWHLRETLEVRGPRHRGCAPLVRWARERCEAPFLSDWNATSQIDPCKVDGFGVRSELASGSDSVPAVRLCDDQLGDLGIPGWLAGIVEQVHDGVAVVDNEARILYANPAFSVMHGCTPEQLRSTHSIGSVFYSGSEWNGPVQSLMHQALRSGVGRAEVVRSRADGTTFPAHVTLSLLRDENGGLVGRILCVQDITERRRSEDRSRLSERRLADAQEIAHLGSWEWDVTSGELTWSDQLFRIFGRQPGWIPTIEAYLGQVHPDDRPGVQTTIWSSLETRKPFEFGHRIHLPDGTLKFVHSRGEVVVDNDGQPAAMRGTAQDVTEAELAQAALRGANARLRELATTDSLTGLPNRALFNDRLEQTLALARREDRNVALLFVDLDRFKVVNDSLGHDRGDELLVEVARRLRGVVGNSDTVARLGGDEFALLLAGSSSPEEAAAAAGRVLESLRPSFVSGGLEFFIACSVGVALWPEDCSSKAELLQHADLAMYRAKSAGGDRFEMFQPTMTVAARERLSLEAGLRRAIECGELVLRYHPQIDLRTGAVTAMEALVRWNHPVRGEIPPSEFITLAEESSLIVPLGAWVLREACRQAATWKQESLVHGPLRMAVNVSPRQLADPRFVTFVSSALTESGIEPSQLELEITESILIHDTGPAITALNSLRRLGVSLAIDDFGTGYSSLSYLRRFPIDRLKLDKAFVAGIGRGDNPATVGDEALVAAVINLAHALGVEAVAEGVETEGQLASLRGFGCEQGQGYLWTMPLLASEVGAWLASHLP